MEPTDFKVAWSEELGGYIAMADKWPTLQGIDDDPVGALDGLICLIEGFDTVDTAAKANDDTSDNTSEDTDEAYCYQEEINYAINALEAGLSLADAPETEE